MSTPYLVTGCAGFIGATVCAKLLESGHQVVGWDNLNDAYDPRLKKWRLDRLLTQPRFRFAAVNIADRRQVEERFCNDEISSEKRQSPYAAVINLAARAGVRASVENPWIYVETNVTGTLNLLAACRAASVPKFVLASTSSLYGGDNPTPYTESTPTDRPLSPYAASKKAAEALAYSYHHLHGLDVTVLRYFTVYGPAGRPDMSVFRFIRQIAEGYEIVVYGDGSQERDFTYVDDIARGTIAALVPCGFEVINLGGDHPVRLAEIIDRIAARVGRPPRIRYEPPHPADVQATWADISKARRLLDWAPQISIEEGLRRCVDGYLDHRDVMSGIRL
jgi:nucleoside-diphosphate-sugar epimerase